MGASKTLITNLLEMRYDYQSSRNVLNNWRKHIHLKEDIDSYDDVQLRSLLEYLKDNAPEAGRLHEAIERQILAKDEPVIEEHHEEPAEINGDEHCEAPVVCDENCDNHCDDNCDNHCDENCDNHCGDNCDNHCDDNHCDDGCCDNNCEDNGENHADDNNGENADEHKENGKKSRRKKH